MSRIRQAKIGIKISIIFSLSALNCNSAIAQTATNADQPTPLNTMVSCSEIAENASRLACYDSHAQTVKMQIETGNLVAIYKHEITEARRGLFGIDRIRMPSFIDSEAQDITEINAAIDAAIRSPSGKWVFNLDDGSQWEQIDTSNPYFNSRKGTEVRIRRGSIGSYLLTVGNASAIRVSRRR